MNVDGTTVMLAVLVMTIASTVQASVGFGANMLAAPTFALLDPDLVPGPIFIAAAVLTFATARRERGDIDRTVVGWATTGRIPGTIAGAAVLAVLNDRTLQLLVGATILVAVALSAGVVRIRETRGTYLGAGIVSGFGAASAAIGGPPVALVLQHRSGPALRSTMGAYFAIGAVITLPAIAAAGRLGRAEILLGLVLIPGALAGFFLSGPLRPRVDAGRVRPLILGLAALAAVILILRSL